MKTKIAAIAAVQARALTPDWEQRIRTEQLTVINDEAAVAFYTQTEKVRQQVVHDRVYPVTKLREDAAEEWERYRAAVLFEQYSLGKLITRTGPVHAEANIQHIAELSGVGYEADDLVAYNFQSKPRALIVHSETSVFDSDTFELTWKLHCSGAHSVRCYWEQHDNDFSRWQQRPIDQPERWEEYGPNILGARTLHWVEDEIILIQAAGLVESAEEAEQAIRAEQARTHTGQPG